MRAALIFAWLIFSSIVCWYMLGQNNPIVNPALTTLKSNTEVQVIDEASGSSYTDNVDDDQSEVKNSDNNQLSNSEDQNSDVEVSNNKMTSDTESSSSSKVVKAEGKETFDFLERTYIQFNQNSSSLPNMPEFEKYLDSVANVVKSKDLIVLLVGHADSVKGRKFDNNIMGMKRANYIKKALIDRNISTENIVVESKGDTEPRVKGNTPEAKEKNRRVELFLKQNK